jgi:hypothetical protein
VPLFIFIKARSAEEKFKLAIRIECYYGQSGTAKSEAIAAVIRQIYEQDGLTSRVIVGDGSKATYVDKGLVDTGVVEVCDFSIRPWPLTVMARLCEGYWPVDVEDPTSPLAPPKMEDLKKLGVFGIEGLSVGAQYIMGDIQGGLAEQSGRGIKIGQDSPVFSKDVLFDKAGSPIKGSGPKVLGPDGKVADEVYSYGGNPVAHYGYAQRRLLANVERTKAFPNIVIWTAHERSTQDKVSGEKLVGPEAAGEAITANLPRVFNNTLHFVTAQRKKEKLKDSHTEQMITDLDTEYRIYTRDHFHPDGAMFVKYKAITRGGLPQYDPKTAPEGMPLYLTSDVPGRSILEFYSKVSAFRKAQAASLKKTA